MRSVHIELGEYGWLADVADVPDAGGLAAARTPSLDAWAHAAPATASSPASSPRLPAPAAAIGAGLRPRSSVDGGGPAAPPPYGVGGAPPAGEAPAAEAASRGAWAKDTWSQLRGWLVLPARREEVATRLESLLGEAEGWLSAGEDVQAAALYRGMLEACRRHGLGVRDTLLRATAHHHDPLLMALWLDGAERSAAVLLAGVPWRWVSLGVDVYVDALVARLDRLGQSVCRRLLRGNDAAAAKSVERMVRLLGAGATLLGRHRRPLADYVSPELGTGLVVTLAERYGCLATRRMLLQKDDATRNAYLGQLEDELVDALRAHRIDLAQRRLDLLEAFVAEQQRTRSLRVDALGLLAAWTGTSPSGVASSQPPGPDAPATLTLWSEQLEAAYVAPETGLAASPFDLAARLGLTLSSLVVVDEAEAQPQVVVLRPGERYAAAPAAMLAACGLRQSAPAVVAWALQRHFAGTAGAACDLPMTAEVVRVLARALLVDVPSFEADAGGPAQAVAFLHGLRRRLPLAPPSLRRLTLDADVGERLPPQLRAWIDGEA